MLSKKPNTSFKLNRDVMSLVVSFTGDKCVETYMRDYIHPYMWKLDKRNVLIYGEIQSGKTDEIIKIIREPIYDTVFKILIIQNNLLTLNQYKERFTNENVSFQIISKTTKKINKNVIILMNNKFRYNYFMKFQKQVRNYVILMDESDMYFRHPLAGKSLREFYITATPYLKKYKNFFHMVKQVRHKKNYVGLENINIQYMDEENNTINAMNAISDFIDESSQGQIMLINCFSKINEMNDFMDLCSHHFPNNVFILLSSEKKMMKNNHTEIIKEKSISGIIDKYYHEKIIFIAYRLSSRGVSYTSSDFTKHLTHQYTNYTNGQSKRSILQRLRIFGVYKDNMSNPPILYMPVLSEEKMDNLIVDKKEMLQKLRV